MTKNVVWHQHAVSTKERARQKNQRPCVVWFTGLSCSGKSTIANIVDRKLYELGFHAYVLDGDNVRHGLNSDLEFTDADRRENVRRVGEVSKLLVDAGLIVLATFISPSQTDREAVRKLHDDTQFFEIFVDASLESCESRDTKGLYARARAGEIANFTGISSKYETPTCPDLILSTDAMTEEECATKVVEYLTE